MNLSTTPASMNLLQKFESLLHAYPEAEPTLPPKGFIAFIWACSRGARGFILLMAARILNHWKMTGNF